MSGETIGPYTVHMHIGSGAAADVYTASGPEGVVALKRCHSNDPRARLRFQREIAALRQLRHPGLVKLLASGEDDDPPWYAMEDLGRVSLRDVLNVHGGHEHDLKTLVQAVVDQQRPVLPAQQRQPFTEAIALSLIEQVSAAIAHVHSRGMLHRDLKPENIMLRSNGDPVVIDVGLVSELRADEGRLTASSDALGTLAYMAPEQGGGSHTRVDERCDVYALGQCLCELLVGQPRPQPGLPQPKSAPAPNLRAVPKPLARIIKKATDPMWRWRYPSVPAFLADCARYRRGEPVVAGRDPWYRPPMRLAMRYPRRTISIVLVMVVVMSLTWLQASWWRLQYGTWHPPQALLIGSTRLATLDVQGVWQRKGDQLEGQPGARLISSHNYPGRLDVALSWAWRPDNPAAEGPRLLVGAGNDAPPGWALGFLRPDLLVLWRHGHPWWYQRVEPSQKVHALRLFQAPRHLHIYFAGELLARVPTPLGVPAGPVGVMAGASGQTVVTDWTVRVPSLPALLPAEHLARNMLAESDAAGADTVAYFTNEASALLQELAESKRIVAHQLPHWQLAVHRQQLRHARDRGDDHGATQAAQAIKHLRRQYTWSEEQRWSMGIALLEEAMRDELQQALITADQDQRAQVIIFLLRLRSPHERRFCAPLRDYLQQTLPAPDPWHTVANHRLTTPATPPSPP